MCFGKTLEQPQAQQEGDPIIISASRRTDIPAFYGNWFMNQVRQGYTSYTNPFGSQRYTVSLKAEDVSAFVFWSKNYKPFIKSMEQLSQMGYDFYLHFTITGLPKDPFEKGVPDTDTAIRVFKFLANTYSPKHLLWRYDPIIISNITPPEFHIKTFTQIAKQLRGYTTKCYFSFVNLYKKTVTNLSRLKASYGIEIAQMDTLEKVELARTLACIAAEHQITMYACCQDYLVAPHYNILKAHCVDAFLVQELFPSKTIKLKINPTRSQCGCFFSKDIGAYDTCMFGCADSYCYATRSSNIARSRSVMYNRANIRDT